MGTQEIKQRFGIIGNSPLLEHAIDTARQVAPTDITVLITGESGTGKEVFPQIIHNLSSRKHGHYIAVNCGAMKRALSQGLTRPEKDISKWLVAEPFSWMR
jgi:transcriptional regulator with PAS, ATPase and Fis domain